MVEINVSKREKEKKGTTQNENFLLFFQLYIFHKAKASRSPSECVEWEMREIASKSRFYRDSVMESASKKRFYLIPSSQSLNMSMKVG